MFESPAEAPEEASGDGRARSPRPGQPPARTPTDDLSAEIVRTVAKGPGDVVRCTRIGGNAYRCNWWAPEATGGYDNPGMGGPIVTTHRIRKSEFLHVVRGAGGALDVRVVD